MTAFKFEGEIKAREEEGDTGPRELLQQLTAAGHQQPNSVKQATENKTQKFQKMREI